MVPDYTGSSFNPEKLRNEDHEPAAERAELHEEYAHLWNNVSLPGMYPQGSGSLVLSRSKSYVGTEFETNFVTDQDLDDLVHDHL